VPVDRVAKKGGKKGEENPILKLSLPSHCNKIEVTVGGRSKRDMVP